MGGDDWAVDVIKAGTKVCCGCVEVVVIDADARCEGG